MTSIPTNPSDVSLFILDATNRFQFEIVNTSAEFHYLVNSAYSSKVGEEVASVRLLSLIKSGPDCSPELYPLLAKNLWAAVADLVGAQNINPTGPSWNRYSFTLVLLDFPSIPNGPVLKLNSWVRSDNTDDNPDPAELAEELTFQTLEDNPAWGISETDYLNHCAKMAVIH